jgi:hypothetical protein
VSAGNLSTLGFIVGGLGLAGGAVLWFTAPTPGAAASESALGVAPGGVKLKVTF